MGRGRSKPWCGSALTIARRLAAAKSRGANRGPGVSEFRLAASAALLGGFFLRTARRLLRRFLDCFLCRFLGGLLGSFFRCLLSWLSRLLSGFLHRLFRGLLGRFLGGFLGSALARFSRGWRTRFRSDFRFRFLHVNLFYYHRNGLRLLFFFLFLFVFLVFEGIAVGTVSVIIHFVVSTVERLIEKRHVSSLNFARLRRTERRQFVRLNSDRYQKKILLQ